MENDGTASHGWKEQEYYIILWKTTHNGENQEKACHEPTGNSSRLKKKKSNG